MNLFDRPVRAVDYTRYSPVASRHCVLLPLFPAENIKLPVLFSNHFVWNNIPGVFLYLILHWIQKQYSNKMYKWIIIIIVTILITLKVWVAIDIETRIFFTFLWIFCLMFFEWRAINVVWVIIITMMGKSLITFS